MVNCFTRHSRSQDTLQCHAGHGAIGVIAMLMFHGIVLSVKPHKQIPNYRYRGSLGRQGFTIVELLMVIVIIAVLAVIVTVTFNGITGRAYDSAIKSDLARFAKGIQLYAAENEGYPRANGIRYTPTSWPSTSDSTRFDRFKYKASKHAYETDLHRNLFYCEGTIGGKRLLG